MKSGDIRKKFLKYFEDHRHAVVKSSSLLPDDPSVLLTTAGMQQFKPYYVGKADPVADFGGRNTVSVQKCFRTSDIDEVGDRTHLTFFEMLGNFSFGGYFKKEAIAFAYDFIVNVCGIDRERITVTVFGGDHEVPEDKESYALWHSEMGLPAQKIKKCGRADNFWGPTGAEGPCGPTTEIYVDGVEIWNVVFNEYYQNPDKSLKPLTTPGVDTGMGLERLAVMLQGATDVFETDLFHGIINEIRSVTHGIDDRIVRILADHIRASMFLIADGVRPSNKEAGYILRRLLRRVLVYSLTHDIHADLFPLIGRIVSREYGSFYPEVRDADPIIEVMSQERTKFEKALANGLKELHRYSVITAQDAFHLYETFGLPWELLKELAPDKVAQLNVEDFQLEFKKHQDISRAGVEKKFGGHGLLLDTGELKAANQEELEKVVRLHTATHVLQQALRQVLGEEVKQMGSDITVERTRFDFSFPRKLTEEELRRVESLVNEIVQRDLPVSYEELPIEEAKKTGALFFFKEKYPDRVKVYSVGDFSKEFCGGPHVTHTLEIGTFKIVKQEAVGAGIRRLRATVG